jgi:hypothetical protein
MVVLLLLQTLQRVIRPMKTAQCYALIFVVLHGLYHMRVKVPDSVSTTCFTAQGPIKGAPRGSKRKLPRLCRSG